MLRTEIISDPSGYYVLTRDGQIGVYDRQKQFQIDAELTAVLRAHNAQFLKQYLTDGDGKFGRLGLVYPTTERRAWKSASMFLEEMVLRRVYPTTAVTAPLTAFQLKNREKSFYQGMEVLLELRNKQTSTVAFWPMLLDRGMMLNQYLPRLGRAEQDGDAATPVVDVVNLLAGLPVSERSAPALQALEKKLHAVLERKHQRRTAEFTLVNNVVFDKEKGEAVYQVNARAEQDLTLSADALEKLQTNHRYERVSRWLEIPNRPVEPGHLRQFVHFRELDGTALGSLAEKSLVHTAPGGTALLDHGMMDQWNMYLLEGSVMLTAEDGHTLTVEGGTPKAAAPIAFLKPRKYKVTSLTKASFLWIHDALLGAVRGTQDLMSRPMAAAR